jgi:NADPH-dependent 2,4-dienoyl-CoA reductase/sulfur reductase-like enzyme
MRYLILGGGPAGIAAAKAVRDRDKSAGIVIATEEEGPAYLRPLLTDLIMGRIDVAGLADPQAQDLADRKIEVRRGKRAVGVEPAANRVRFADGTEERYDALLLATGGKPEIPAALGNGHPAIVPFDSLEDSLRIMQRIPRARKVAVYGPGFLAIVASSALRKRGNEVIWFRPDKPRTGYPIAGELEANILDAGGELEVESSERGETVRCAAVVVATERLPSIDPLSASGVKTGTGVIVDDHLRSSVPNIYAAGDCAELSDRKTGEPRINFGWRSAIKQGRLAGDTMAGGRKRYLPEESDYLWVLVGPPLLDRIP